MANPISKRKAEIQVPHTPKRIKPAPMTTDNENRGRCYFRPAAHVRLLEEHLKQKSWQASARLKRKPHMPPRKLKPMHARSRGNAREDTITSPNKTQTTLNYRVTKRSPPMIILTPLTPKTGKTKLCNRKESSRMKPTWGLKLASSRIRKKWKSRTDLLHSPTTKYFIYLNHLSALPWPW